MSKQTFTRRQRQVKRLLAIGCFIRESKNINGRKKYRLLDDNINPLSYVSPRTLKALKQKGVLTLKDNHYVITTSKTNS